MTHRSDIHRWYTAASWLRRRAHQLRIEPLCRHCFERGIITAATVADHVENHNGDFVSFRLGELRSLCAECHNKLSTRTNQPRFAVLEDGSPSDPNHPWNRGA